MMDDRTDQQNASDANAPNGVPRWVKVFGIVALVAVAAIVILVLTGRGGSHSPGRHGAPAEALLSAGAAIHEA